MEGFQARPPKIPVTVDTDLAEAELEQMRLHVPPIEIKASVTLDESIKGEVGDSMAKRRSRVEGESKTSLARAVSDMETTTNTAVNNVKRTAEEAGQAVQTTSNRADAGRAGRETMRQTASTLQSVITSIESSARSVAQAVA
jgi:hypothetical protein